MDAIGHGIIEAFKLIFAGDGEIFEIVGLSLYVSCFSVVFSTCAGIPLVFSWERTNSEAKAS